MDCLCLTQLLSSGLIPSDFRPSQCFFLAVIIILKFPSRTSIAPEVEEDFVKGRSKATEFEDMETNLLVGHRKTENAICELNHIKVYRRATDGGLKDQTHRKWAKTKPTTTKRSNQEERRTRRSKRRNRKTKTLPDHRLNTQTWAET